EEGLPYAPDAADTAVERAVVVEQMPGARVSVAAEEVAGAVEAAIPRGLDVVGGRGDDVVLQAVPAQLLRERHRLAGPLATGLVRARHLRVVVARAARERDRELRVHRQAALVPDRVREQRARDRLVVREPPGEEI